MRNDDMHQNLGYGFQAAGNARAELVSDAEGTGSLSGRGYPKAFPRQPSEDVDRRFILETDSASPAPCPFCGVTLSAASRK